MVVQSLSYKQYSGWISYTHKCMKYFEQRSFAWVWEIGILKLECLVFLFPQEHNLPKDQILLLIVY